MLLTRVFQIDLDFILDYPLELVAFIILTYGFGSIVEKNNKWLKETIRDDFFLLCSLIISWLFFLFLWLAINKYVIFPFLPNT